MKVRCLLVLALVALPTLAAAQTVRKIVIDPGHGGVDPGGTGNSMLEKTVVLDVSKRFKSLLDADTADTSGGGKWTSLMTRTTDVYVALAARASYSNSNNADRFMCIHSNAFSDPSANGTETYSYDGTGTDAQLRDLVQDEVLKVWHLTNRGNKTADYEVLRDTACPAELHELAFITNTTDAQHLASPTERQKAAEAHLRAIQRHYNITPYIPGSGPTDTTGDIKGVVVDNAGPIGNALVHLDTGTNVTTADDGTFQFMSAAKGTHDVTASATGYQPKTVQVTVAASVTNNVTIQLDPTTQPAPPDAGAGSGDPGKPTPPGCTAGGSGGSGGLLAAALGLLALRRRRRP
jgi:N-acetylmuramoyl-L-alanine amidase